MRRWEVAAPPFVDHWNREQFRELMAVLKSLGVDSREAMRVFCEDRVLNISPAYLRPGFAFGGSCLPKDLRGFLSLAALDHVDVPFLGSLLQSNERHIDRAYEMIASGGRRKVAFFGLSFKPGTDDMRESSALTFVAAPALLTNASSVLALSTIFLASAQTREKVLMRRLALPYYLIAFLGIATGSLGSRLPALAILGILTLLCIVQIVVSLGALGATGTMDERFPG